VLLASFADWWRFTPLKVGLVVSFMVSVGYALQSAGIFRTWRMPDRIEHLFNDCDGVQETPAFSLWV
jgi:hypothetical protein